LDQNATVAGIFLQEGKTLFGSSSHSLNLTDDSFIRGTVASNDGNAFNIGINGSFRNGGHIENIAFTTS
jgi:hypothetical protein